MSIEAKHPLRGIRESQIRRAHQRGAHESEWLQARFSFSFGDYQDPNHMHWGPLRALNEDWVAPGRGFEAHAHRNIETLTYPVSGRIHHVDDLGNDFEFGPGELLRMSAGTGITHAEMNASSTEPERHIQIWLYPERVGTQPSCEKMSLAPAAMRNNWQLIASPDGRDGSVTIQQRALLFVSLLAAGTSLQYELNANRLGYLHVVKGQVQVAPGFVLRAGDGLRFTHKEHLGLAAELDDSEVLLFDL